MEELFTQLSARQATFADVLAYIAVHYDYTPSAFQNGLQHNAATENQGSAKVFAFALDQELTKDQTLALFAEHYTAVLQTPEGTDHQNVRQFMINGWDGIHFEGQALKLK
ncbi:HopJ type III effector protein [Sphingobacterium spiritivorum]